MQFKYSMLTASLVAALTLSGCGGGSSSNSSTDNGGNNGNSGQTEQPLTQGKFIDAPVEGLYYVAQPSGKRGLTDADGTFSLTEGDTVTFYLGGENGLRLGSVSARAVVSPFEVTGGNYQKALNLARMLQSMDNAEDGAITLPESIKAPSEATLTALKQIDLGDMDSAQPLKESLEITQWVDESAALAHLQASLKDIELGSTATLADWQKGSGKYLRTIDVTLAAKNANVQERLYVHADQLLGDELFKATQGLSAMTLRLDEQHLTVLKGANDSTLSDSYAQAYLSCLDAEGINSVFVSEDDSEAGYATCNGKPVEMNSQFQLGSAFSYSLQDPSETTLADETFSWDELKKHGRLFTCLADKNCTESAMTGFEITQFDDSDEQDGSDIQKETMYTSYNAVTGVYTVVSNEEVLSGEHKGRKETAVSFAYLVDNADAERYVDFRGTWKAVASRPGCVDKVISTFTFDDKGVTVKGEEFVGKCETETLDEFATYDELAAMDYWWFKTNGANNDSKATLSQLNTTIRWCDDDELQNDTCQNTKINRWEYAPAGKNWDQGVLYRSTLNSKGNIISMVAMQKQ
ncbi:hypothetical protein [Photobacterium ganghwense]|uniref:hypothetical protein n=1 Tax=Photobacterium ganghwense TaxID=320778 RepID=UPI0039F0CBE6